MKVRKAVTWALAKNQHINQLQPELTALLDKINNLTGCEGEISVRYNNWCGDPMLAVSWTVEEIRPGIGKSSHASKVSKA